MASNNWEKRIIETYGPNFRIEAGNPSMGSDGSDIYALYGTSDENDISLVGMTQGGTYKIHNDRSIEMIAGAKAESTGCDITITGMNGDVNITAMKNGQIRIRGSSIVFDADKDISFTAGNNFTIDAKNKYQCQANIANLDALEGNIAPDDIKFAFKVFTGTYVLDKALGAMGNFM